MAVCPSAAVGDRPVSSIYLKVMLDERTLKII
jgi:hypothetical protein